MATVQGDIPAKLMMLAEARAIYEPCLTKGGVESSLTYDLLQPEFRREYRGGAPRHSRLYGMAPSSSDWFNAVYQIRSEIGDMNPWQTDARAIGPADLRDFMRDFDDWFHAGEGLAVDVTELEHKAVDLPELTEEAIAIARGNSRWGFMEALTWGLLRNYHRVRNRHGARHAY